jgi:hypothetical protein
VPAQVLFSSCGSASALAGRAMIALSATTRVMRVARTAAAELALAARERAVGMREQGALRQLPAALTAALARADPASCACPIQAIAALRPDAAWPPSSSAVVTARFAAATVPFTTTTARHSQRARKRPTGPLVIRPRVRSNASIDTARAAPKSAASSPTIAAPETAALPAASRCRPRITRIASHP